jgi:hypothetical protein
VNLTREKPTYLAPNSQSLQKTIGGGVSIGVFRSQKHVESTALYKGGIVFSERLSAQ